MSWPPPCPGQWLLDELLNETPLLPYPTNHTTTQENTMNKTEIRAALIKYLSETGCWDVDEINELLEVLKMDPIVKDACILVTYSVTVQYEGVEVADFVNTDGEIDLEEALKEHLNFGEDHWVVFEKACERSVPGEIQDVTVTEDPEVV